LLQGTHLADGWTGISLVAKTACIVAYKAAQ